MKNLFKNILFSYFFIFLFFTFFYFLLIYSFFFSIFYTYYLYFYLAFLKFKFFFFNYLTTFLIINLNIILTFICILLGVAFFTLLERKKLSTFQNRKGPNKVGYFGLLQPIADAVKLLLKETVIPRNSNMFLFIISPMLAFLFGVLSWIVIPFSYNYVLANINLGLLFIFCISIFHIYGIIFAGWSSNSRYSFLGALRSSAQLIAYDIAMGLVLLNIVMYTKSLNLIDIIEFQDFNGWFVLYFFCPFILFLVCILAETNRHPFDLPEAESELVSGYNVEYAAITFALFFLAEYAAIIFMCFFTTILFLGGWLTFFFIKFVFFLYFFLFMRAAIPRYRYDQLMRIGWKFILPIALSIFIINFCLYLF